jgi:hypothetical protein
MTHHPSKTRAANAASTYSALLIALCAVGCGSDDASSTGGDAAIVPDTVRYEATVADLITGGPVAGAQVCILDADPADCVATDADGLFAFDLPANTDVALQVMADEYQSALRFIETGDTDKVGNWLSAKVADIDAILSADDTLDWDREKGAVAIFVDLDGVKASLEPASGDLFYLSEAGEVVRDDGTGSPGPSFIDIINVEPGEYELSLDNDGGTCFHKGWTTDRDNVQRLIVRADHLTSLLGASCAR